MQTVGVVGAGVMGAGVAQNLAQTGHKVILLDVSEEALAKARSEIKQNLRFQAFLRKGEEKQSSQSVIEQIQFTTDYGALNAAYFIVENVTEKWEVKRRCYERLEEVCPAPVVFAANTSAITITRIASATKRPQQVIGIHFMNPVPMKGMAEVIRGHHTSAETIETTRKLLARMGKEWVIVNDSPGFVSNRVLMLTVNEAIFLLHEQVASAEDVDNIFKGCFGHKMGPLETADLIGLDTILFSLEVLYESFNDSKFRPCPLLRRMVDAGLHGRKSGQGFYDYAV
jgi:3-hydroxybutyryl-CoA dehydrogenase